MKVRQYSNIECVKIQIDGAGVYHLPQTAFKDKKIDSLLFFALTDGSYQDFSRGMGDNLNNLFIDIFSIEKKPLYVNVPLLSFRIDNLLNRVEEKLDFDLTKITYTGSDALTLYIYFSLGEKIIELKDSYYNVKSLNCDYYSIANGVGANGYNYNLFDNDIASFFIERTSKKINVKNNSIFCFLDFVFADGRSLVKIPSLFFYQSIIEPSNIAPFMIDGVLDLFRSNLDMTEPFAVTSSNPNPSFSIVISSNK